MNISSIADSINPLTLKDNVNIDNKKDSTFSNMLNDAVSEVNKEQLQGYKAMEEIASGKVTNLQHAVQQIEEAELSMKLGLEVKNKALNAYKEVMRMQI